MPREDFERQLARGKITEKQVAEYLKALGYHVLPTTDFAANGAPMLEAADRSKSLVMPDLQAFTKGHGEWWESKLKSSASSTDRFKGRLITGIDAVAWIRYCDVEIATEMPVAIVFVHEKEQEVRCGTLHQLHDVESHRTDRMGKGGMVFWKYESVPLWMSLDELKANIAAQQYQAKLVEPSKPPIVRKLLRQGHATRRHGFTREVSNAHDVFSSSRSAWTWACLVCNATGVGDSASHRCPPNNIYTAARGYWQYRLARSLPNATDAEIAAIVDRPIARDDLAKHLGPTWFPSGDVA